MVTVVDDTIRGVGSTINTVDPLKWYFIPFAILFIFLNIIFVIISGVDTSKPIKGTACSGEGRYKVCRPVEYPGYYKIFGVLLFSSLFSLVLSAGISKGIYNIGLAIYNPKEQQL